MRKCWCWHKTDHITHTECRLVYEIRETGALMKSNRSAKVILPLTINPGTEAVLTIVTFSPLIKLNHLQSQNWSSDLN